MVKYYEIGSDGTPRKAERNALATRCVCQCGRCDSVIAMHGGPGSPNLVCESCGESLCLEQGLTVTPCTES